MVVVPEVFSCINNPVGRLILTDKRYGSGTEDPDRGMVWYHQHHTADTCEQNNTK